MIFQIAEIRLIFARLDYFGNRTVTENFLSGKTIFPNAKTQVKTLITYYH